MRELVGNDQHRNDATDVTIICKLDATDIHASAPRRCGPNLFEAVRLSQGQAKDPLAKEQAVLFQTSSHSGPLEIELTRRKIPFVKFGGLKFLDAAHIKDMLALLRFVENPRDRVAGFRLLHLLPGIGSATAQRVLDGGGGRRPDR